MPGTCRKRWNEYFGVSKQGIKNRAGHVGCKILRTCLMFSAGKSWYVDSNYRRVRWTPSSDEIFSGEYEVSTHRERRDYIVLEAGIGIHF